MRLCLQAGLTQLSTFTPCPPLLLTVLELGTHGVSLPPSITTKALQLDMGTAYASGHKCRRPSLSHIPLLVAIHVRWYTTIT